MELPNRYPVLATAIVLFMISVPLMSCRDSAGVRPAPESVQLSPVEKEAASDMSPVRIVARPESWPESETIEFTTTPVHLKIENRSESPLLIRYSDFKVLTPGGKQFSALPVFPVEEKDSGPVVPGVLPMLTIAAYPPINDPLFDFRDFRVAPFLKPVYPTVPVHEGSFPYDQTYNERLASYWRGFDLPNLEMIRRALPEGVLNPGGWVAGWLYFQKFEPLPAGTLTLDLIDARTDRPFGQARVPVRAR
ncbi:hypothetical protein [Methylocaldum sp.]|uniref:hypothetical protein n=1 Tax=Methylocaldum sp. TaxID=1969727 RepID=UPI002D4CD6F6|nr:hypothetical protein [Methylocaldum sp.]HYE33813.1 hypothetical protein [Methylocaldum sp.]